MLRTFDRIVILVSVVLLAIAISLAYALWKSAEESAVLSCLSSIAAVTDKAISQSQIVIDGSWRELSQSEIENLLAENKYLDCWDQHIKTGKIHIAIGRVNKEKPQDKVKVWTNGDDGIQGTLDDLVIPYGEKAP